MQDVTLKTVAPEVQAVIWDMSGIPDSLKECFQMSSETLPFILGNTTKIH